METPCIICEESSFFVVNGPGADATDAAPQPWGLLYNPVTMISFFRFSGGMKLTRENRSTRGKNCPSANLSTTNPTWIDPGSNPGLRG